MADTLRIRPVDSRGAELRVTEWQLRLQPHHSTATNGLVSGLPSPRASWSPEGAYCEPAFIVIGGALLSKTALLGEFSPRGGRGRWPGHFQYLYM